MKNTIKLDNKEYFVNREVLDKVKIEDVETLQKEIDSIIVFASLMGFNVSNISSPTSCVLHFEKKSNTDYSFLLEFLLDINRKEIKCIEVTAWYKNWEMFGNQISNKMTPFETAKEIIN